MEHPWQSSHIGHKAFFHKENQTVVEWYSKNNMNDGSIEEFDGMSLVEWADNKIKVSKEVWLQY